MRNILLIAVMLMATLFVVSGCSTKEKLTLSSRQDIESLWVQDTAQIRESGHRVFNDADLLGTIIEAQQDKIVVSTIYREQNGPGVMLGTGVEDYVTISFSGDTVVSTFDMDEELQLFTVHNGDIKDIAAGKVVSIWGQYEGDMFTPDTIVVWSL